MVNETTTTITNEANAPSVQGDFAMTFGTFTARTALKKNTPVTAYIDTGMRECWYLSHQTKTAFPKGIASADTDNYGTTYPSDGSAVQVRVLSDTTGYWMAWGK